MSALGGERGSVQNPVIKYATETGWEYISPEEALGLRGGNTGFVFKELFVNQILHLNPDFMNQELAEELMKRLERVPPRIEGNLIVWEHLKGLRTVFVPAEKRERNVRFIDTENINKNVFQVTDEFSFTNGSKTIRPDVVFLFNGVPVLLIETKAAHKIDGIAEALDQIRRYHREGPELLAIVQLYALTHIIRYYYRATWNTTLKGSSTGKKKLRAILKHSSRPF
jgi:type I restriction enzyme R subunit